MNQLTHLPLIIDHDGNVDDLIAISLLLLHAPERIKAITLTPADCHAKPAAWVTMQLQELLSPTYNIPIGVGSDEGINHFPKAWRDSSWDLAHMPLWNKSEQDLANFTITQLSSAESLLTKTLRNSSTPVIILETGPSANIALMLRNHPELREKIHRIFIMGGALQKGNVEQPGHDGSAEWNIYNNPQALYDVLYTGIPITLVPLEATQHAPISKDLMKQLRNNRHITACELVYEALQTIRASIETGEYMLWDALTSVAIINPAIIQTKKMKINGQLNGPSMGKIFEDPNGFEIDVAISANQELFEQTVLDILEKQ